MNRSEKVLKVKCSLNFGGEGTAMRAVIAASLAALSISGVYAQDSVPLPQAGDTTAGASSDYTQESSIKEYPSKLEGGGYTLTQLEQKPDSGDFVTGYSYDSLNKTATPAYYRLDLKQTEYGTGDSVKYWGWTTDENGNKTFGEVGESEADVTFRYNTPASSLDRVESSGGSSSITLDDITGSFVGQTGGSGGAVSFMNTNIDKITADFINNSATSSGGAIFHTAGNGSGSIKAIIGDFIGNNVKDLGNGSAAGGAIWMQQSIGAIKGNFAGNYVESNGDAMGGAIANVYMGYYGSIGSIEGNFIGNYVKGAKGSYGGAIVNGSSDGSRTPHIQSIKGDFLGNHAVAETGSASGGAIANINYQTYVGLDSLAIDSISGNFIGNYAESVEQSASGGAIRNDGTIGSISGDFIGNYASGREAEGGAIYNSGRIGETSYNVPEDKILDVGCMTVVNTETGEKLTLYLVGTTDGGYAPVSELENLIKEGYKIFPEMEQEEMPVDSEQWAEISQQYDEMLAQGVVSAEDPTKGLAEDAFAEYEIHGITGDFIGNYASGQVGAAGGAIYNEEQIGDITGDFIGNYVSAQGETLGGAIYNEEQIGDITGDFIGNYASGQVGAAGGAIANAGKIGGIKGDFIGNYASGEMAAGGAIYNAGFWSGYYGEEETVGGIASITGDFIGNYASGQIEAVGGAIYNTGTIGYQRVITIISGTAVNSDTGETVAYYVAQNGNSIADIQDMIANGYQIEVKDEGQFEVSDAKWQEMISDIKANPDTVFTTAPEELFGKENMYSGTVPAGIVNSSFIGNYAKSEAGEAAAGAIYTNQNLMLAAKDGYTSIISGNYVEDINGKRNEAIYVDEQAELGFEATSNGQFVIDDMINGTDGYSVSFSGDETGVVYLNNKITAEIPPVSSTEDGSTQDETQAAHANISMSDITLNLGQDNFIDNNNLTLNSGNVNMINNQAGVSALNTFTLSGDVNMMVDVDLANSTMDRITAQNYGEHTGNINVTGMNLLSDAPEGVNTTDIYFAEQGLKDHVTNGAGALPDSKWQTTAYTPIYKYNVTYDNREDAGYFLFTRGQGGSSGGSTGGNPSDIFNPGILSTPVAAQAGAYAAQNAAFTYAFTHPDTFMPLPSVDRFALRHANQYALSSYDSLSMQMNDLQEKGIWVRPYTSFESIPLDNGPDVDTITYGTMIGGDSKFKELKNGWGTVFTGYIGYNGSSQHYDGVSTYQNGGLIGATQSFYKGNFFTALTASVGASAGESHNMYGKDDFTMLMAGIASKSGYNIEFKNGKFIIQPSLLLSYSFINTFDYTTASGVHMDSDPMHAIQINPNVKFIGNLKNGWQPYASVGMVWNLLDGTNVRADNVRLPEMSIKPYVEYGVGIQKRWQDKYTGYVQAMVRNGGRNGVALTAGFRWALGQDGKPIEKVDKNVNKTSRTDRIGILSW